MHFSIHLKKPNYMPVSDFSPLGKRIQHAYDVYGDHMTALATVSATLAFIMEITKFWVLRRTSSITVSVLGIVKVIYV